MIERDDFSCTIETIQKLIPRKPRRPRQSPLQLVINVTYKVKHRLLFYSQAGATGTIRTNGYRIHESNYEAPVLKFISEASMFAIEKDATANCDISCKLAQFGIEPPRHEEMVVQIIDKIRGIVNRVPEKHKRLWLFCAIERRHEIIFEPMDLIEGAAGEIIERNIMESSMEFEGRNFGMVPADHTSALKLIKLVKVESAGEDCMICLDKLSGFATAMPCSHLFYGKCIFKWLAESHRCPLCRFEMPKMESHRST